MCELWYSAGSGFALQRQRKSLYNTPIPKYMDQSTSLKKTPQDTAELKNGIIETSFTLTYIYVSHDIQRKI